MFLLYRNNGERRYGQEQNQPYPRGAWEFQFILRGKCNLLVREGGTTRTERIVEPALVVTAPDCVHAWGGQVTDVCQTMIFHFDEADYTVRSILGKNGWRNLSFHSNEIPLLEALYERCAEARRAVGTTPLEARKRAGFFEPLIYRVVATELTLFFLKYIRESELGVPPNFAASKVNEAVAWYEANLSRSPKISDVADAIHVSATHLRRLFHKIRGESPQAIFTRIQFERTIWLMREPRLNLEQIAEFAGFGSSSAFSRAFKVEFGIPPWDFREDLRTKTAQGE